MRFIIILGLAFILIVLLCHRGNSINPSHILPLAHNAMSENHVMGLFA